jgi:hypothetical protein
MVSIKNTLRSNGIILILTSKLYQSRIDAVGVLVEMTNGNEIVRVDVIDWATISLLRLGLSDGSSFDFVFQFGCDSRKNDHQPPIVQQKNDAIQPTYLFQL